MMERIYRHKFHSLYSNIDDLNADQFLWSKHLKDISDKSIEEAIDRCVDEYEWVPNIGEFKKLCGSYEKKHNKSYRDSQKSSVLKNFDIDEHISKARCKNETEEDMRIRYRKLGYNC